MQNRDLPLIVNSETFRDCAETLWVLNEFLPGKFPSPDMVADYLETHARVMYGRFQSGQEKSLSYWGTIGAHVTYYESADGQSNVCRCDISAYTASAFVRRLRQLMPALD